jgi:four helix bundle protein
MVVIDSYRKLIVWQKSFELVKEIYTLTDTLPKDEQFGLVSQMRRCAVSIPSNIAEGQQRNNAKEYRQFLGIARGSAAELSTQLLLVQELHNKDVRALVEKAESIQKMLFSLLQKL